MKKEKTVNDDRITYRQLGQLIDGRDTTPLIGKTRQKEQIP
jgi:hypothetical protein